jgi:hypothetical protein
MLRQVAAAAFLCTSYAGSALALARRRRGEIAWSLAAVVVATGTGIVVAAWLGGA